MIKRPQTCISPKLMEIWPVDEWSRKIVTTAITDAGINYNLNPTTMGHPALRFATSEDYEKALSIIKDITIE